MGIITLCGKYCNKHCNKYTRCFPSVSDLPPATADCFNCCWAASVCLHQFSVLLPSPPVNQLLVTLLVSQWLTGTHAVVTDHCQCLVGVLLDFLVLPIFCLPPPCVTVHQFISAQDSVEYPGKPWKLASINAHGQLEVTIPDWLKQEYPTYSVKIAPIVGTTGAGKSKIASYLGKKLLQSSSGRHHCTEGMYAQPVILHNIKLVVLYVDLEGIDPKNAESTKHALFFLSKIFPLSSTLLAVSDRCCRDDSRNALMWGAVVEEFFARSGSARRQFIYFDNTADRLDEKSVNEAFESTFLLNDRQPASEDFDSKRAYRSMCDAFHQNFASMQVYKVPQSHQNRVNLNTKQITDFRRTILEKVAGFSSRDLHLSVFSFTDCMRQMEQLGNITSRIERIPLLSEILTDKQQLDLSACHWRHMWDKESVLLQKDKQVVTNPTLSSAEHRARCVAMNGSDFFDADLPLDEQTHRDKFIRSRDDALKQHVYQGICTILSGDFSQDGIVERVQSAVKTVSTGWQTVDWSEDKFFVMLCAQRYVQEHAFQYSGLPSINAEVLKMHLLSAQKNSGDLRSSVLGFDPRFRCMQLAGDAHILQVIQKNLSVWFGELQTQVTDLESQKRELQTQVTNLQQERDQLQTANQELLPFRQHCEKLKTKCNQLEVQNTNLTQTLQEKAKPSSTARTQASLLFDNNSKAFFNQNLH